MLSGDHDEGNPRAAAATLRRPARCAFARGRESTLVRGLAGRLPAASAIFLDHYERFTQRPVDDMRRWLREGADPDMLAIPGLADDLAALKSGRPVADPLTGNAITPGRYVLLETQFGRRPVATGRHIDFS